MMKIKCIAIDDEPVALDIIRNHVNQIPFLNLVKVYRDAYQAIEYIQSHQVDLIFLDINMPDLSGIQFIKSLDNPPLVIFTTAYSEFALESYEYEAVDYLLKPIEFNRFLKAINRAKNRIQNQEETVHINHDRKDYVIIKSGSEFYKINLNDILFIKGTGNYLTFHTEKKEIMTLMTMAEALEMLPDKLFYRIHKSYIISFSKIDVIEREQVRIGQVLIPIGETFRSDFLKLFKKK